MTSPDANLADFTFATDAYPANELKVLGFRGQEEISRPFEFEITLVSELDDIELEEMIGQTALLTLRGASGQRYVHGVVQQFDQVAVGRKFSEYVAHLVPTVAPLAYTRNSRIFQEISTPDIVEKVLSDAGFSAECLTRKLQGTYDKRDFCVQYQESDLAFVSRLMEEEGIFFYFEHSPDSDVLVMGDGDSAVEPLPDAPTVPFRDESLATTLQEEAFSRFRARASMRPGRASMRDFRFKHPSIDLEVTESAEARDNLEMYYFPGEYTDPGLGRKLVRVRIEELQADRSRFTAVGTSRALTPGYSFKLELHPRHEFNQEYLIVSVKHRGTQLQSLTEEHGAGQVAEKTYSSQLQCVPADIPYRPPRVTPRPNIAGLQSATVAGPPGEEIYCDEYGRVKVQFNWDRQGGNDDRSSCWIRVSQPWAGTSWGAIFIPRIGQEVLVQFLEGDPDRPVVIGRVYNADCVVPYDLPANKTRATIKTASTGGGGGYNELRFEDACGQEEVYLQAEKDFNELVKNEHATDVGSNQFNKVGANQTNKVAANQKESIGANQTMSVGANRDKSVGVNETSNIGVNRTKTVGANETSTIGANRTLTVGGNEMATIGGTRIKTICGPSIQMWTGGSFHNISGGEMNITAGGEMRILDGGKMSLTSGGVLEVESGGSTKVVMGSQNTFVTGSCNKTVGGSATHNYGGNLTRNVAGTTTFNAPIFAVNAPTYNITCASKNDGDLFKNSFGITSISAYAAATSAYGFNMGLCAVKLDAAGMAQSEKGMSLEFDGLKKVACGLKDATIGLNNVLSALSVFL